MYADTPRAVRVWVCGPAVGLWSVVCGETGEAGTGVSAARVERLCRGRGSVHTAAGCL